MKENREVTYTNVGDMENSIEEDIILLKDFTEGNFKRDKLENYKGSYKMGFFYYKDIQQAIEHILKENEQLRTEVNRFKEENRKLKQKLSTHKKVLCVEQTMLQLIKARQGSYENIAKVIYGQEVNNYNLVAIRTVISRLRKKGYNIQNVENWGYIKEETNG